MNPLFSVLLLTALLTPLSCLAGETKQLELSDGTVLTGQLVRVENGTYTFRSESLGTVQIRESEVRSLRGAASDRGAAPATDIQALQQQMLGDPATMSLLLSLQQDPDMQELLADKEIMNAIVAGNLDALRGNARFEKLLRHPTVQQIQQNLAQPR